MRPTSIAALVVATFIASACASSSRPTGAQPAPRMDLSLITHEQMEVNHFANAFDAVSALRSNWLQPHGPDSFMTPSIVLVYLDNSRMGGIDRLREIPIKSIVYVRHYDGIDATTRWGVGHSAGVIFVSTRPERVSNAYGQ